MGSCEERPSVTLWGTTQVTTLTTVLSTITRPDAPRITSSVTSVSCDGDGNCGPVVRPTIIVNDADMSYVTVTKETVVTNIIPVQTRYHPCPSASSVAVEPAAESSMASVSVPTTSTSGDSLTLTNTVPAPTSRSINDEPASPSRLSLTRNGDITQSAILGETTASSPIAITTQDDSPPLLSYTSNENGFSTIPLPDSTDSPLPLPNVSTGLDGSNSSSTSSSTPIGSSEIAGIVIGSLAGLIFLGLFILRCKGRRHRKEGGLVHHETYWERRFQELEGGVEKPVSSPGAGMNDPPEEEGTHQLHMSLKLGSHHPIINRPASRLSAISSFFGGGGGRDSPGPSRIAAIRNRQAGANADGNVNANAIDFSQPRTDDGEIQGQGTDRFNLRSYGARTTTKTASVKSGQSNATATSGRMSLTNTTNHNERRGSAWPFAAITAVIASSIKGGGSDDGSSAHHATTRGNGTRQTEARKGMEWIRTIVSSDSGFGFNNHYYQGQQGYNDSPTNTNTNGRGLPPPPRSRGVSPLPSLASDTSSPVSGPAAPTGESRIRQSAFPDLHPDTSSPAPPVYEPRTRSPESPSRTHDHDLPIGSGGLAGSRQLYPSNSLRKKRQHKGLPVPDLELNQDAISPSLWIDDETLDRFGRSQVSPTQSRPQPQPQTQPQHQAVVTAVTAGERPPVPSVPQSSTAVPPLNLSKRTIFPTSIPPLSKPTKPTQGSAKVASEVAASTTATQGTGTGTAIGPTGPSAFNANVTELMSRFSPDSSRASFSTLQDHARRRGSETSMKDLPGLPPPPPATQAQAQESSGVHSNSTPRIGVDGQAQQGQGQGQGQGQQPRRFDRSAVTPQLPTLATSNADAFRAELVEWSASTGSSDRMERVISFHGNRD